ncbi:AAA family ATPase [Bacteroidota bacterium]
MKHNPRYPLKHLSVRVPWHDNKWNGTVCNDPKNNGACLILKNCSKNRNDEKESAVAGASIQKLDQDQFPVCVSERGTFMASFGFDRIIPHPYSKISPKSHGNLKKTMVHFPAYSAAAVPYYWLLKQNTEELVKRYDLDYNEENEPQLDWEGSDHWVQQFDNQKTLLNCFFEHFKEETSLIFFYAKQAPFVEASGRVVVGIGRINKIIPSEKYEGSNLKFSAAYWEHMVLHSIRPNFEDGFILPYHEAIEYQKKHSDFDPSTLAVMVTNDKQFEYSYASEHVTNDSAIQILLSCINSIEIARDLGIGNHHDKIIRWIHDELIKIQKLRGCYPGMGAALSAFGIEKGHFIAAEIINGLNSEHDNPWKIFEKALGDPQKILSPEIASLIPDQSKKLYKKLSDRKSVRIDLLHLLSRFDLSVDQATTLYIEVEREQAGISENESSFVNNPYLIYEITRYIGEPISFDTIDLGMIIKKAPNNLLPENVILTDPLHSNRIRALTIQQLTLASYQGHTLLPRKELIKQIRNLSIEPKCNLNSDYYEIAEEEFAGSISIDEMKSGEVAYQLIHLAACGQIIRQKVKDRIKAESLSIKGNWDKLLKQTLDKVTKGNHDEQEEKARQEKAASLKELSRSRFSVLIGPAGTGKTTLLTILASLPEIQQNGVLLLAPTGKARVRMEEIAKDIDVTAKTLAQFLKDYDRYDGSLQRYKLSKEFCTDVYETVILDESSMLTEEMLATALDCLKTAKRFILVGDHRQLPPIGPGRPFVDIIHHLKPDNIETLFPRVSKGYSELTIKRRQGGSKRQDMQLAEWFSGESLEPGADNIFHEILLNKDSEYLRLVSWKNESDFEKIFEEVLVQELGLTNLKDVEKFNIELGSSDGQYFNSSKDANYFKIEPSVNFVEHWQILSPVREKPFGVKALNRKIHKVFRKATIEDATIGRKITYNSGFEKTERKIPKPLGIEQIVYGDKVINLGNHQRRRVYPKEQSLEYLANGEIGIVTGQFKRKSDRFKGQPQYIQIEFSSQKGYVYTFISKDFKEEGEPPLELAYALTVHKSQGSEFKKVFLIIPNPCFLLTREMLYTALTRQTERVIVLYQGSKLEIKELSSPIHSDTLIRITNLFIKPELVEVGDRYLEKNLIQQASDGQMLRSKSELLIYQRLIDKGLEPIYEKKLVIKEVEKLPDFTIENTDTGEVYYWEHCGMLFDAEYKERWDDKYKWYLKNKILPWDQEKGKNGSLIITEDKPQKLVDGTIRGAISLKEIDELIIKIFGI